MEKTKSDPNVGRVRYLALAQHWVSDDIYLLWFENANMKTMLLLLFFLKINLEIIIYLKLIHSGNKPSMIKTLLQTYFMKSGLDKQ